MQISMIAAMSANRVIGNNNSLPWTHLPRDMKHFVQVTRGKTVIMGRKCFQSIGKALPKRHNIVLTKDKKFIAEGCTLVHSYEDAMLEAQASIMGDEASSEVVVIGGEEIYRMFLDQTTTIHLTEIQADYQGDSFFPELGPEWRVKTRAYFPRDEQNAHSMRFVELVRT